MSSITDRFARGEALPGYERTGLEIERRFTTASAADPLDLVEWERRDVEIKATDGTIVFAQKGVEVPKSWSQVALQVTASKYFRGTLGTDTRESSVRTLIERVVRTITQWGIAGGYFKNDRAMMSFDAELKHILVNQMAAFNSPVWFNVGVEEKPQCSACFINSVDDTMESILALNTTEGMLFKYGSGTGSNLSTIRSAREGLRGGGTASGPLSFMKGWDAFAGAIKSGGKTRRAAKMVILDANHPDIFAFIESKVRAEKAAQALINAGFSSDFTDPDGAYGFVPYQNANHSVRVTDGFMRAAADNSEIGWALRAITTGEAIETCAPSDLFQKAAEAAWACGDPGMQFHDTINAWHTCPNDAMIRASNPCSEYMFLDDSACNLASLNLMKFHKGFGNFDLAGFEHAVDVMITAMEIIVGNSSYPTEKIRENSFKYRPLGLGYANLGALLMANGYAYDSTEGRGLAAGVTALMHLRAYRQSAEIAKAHGGPFERWEANRQPFLRVLEKHVEAVGDIMCSSSQMVRLAGAARLNGVAMLEIAKLHGVRHAQATVLAPTGTIGFMMDCDTTGVEPDIALVKTKKLVGGGSLKYVNSQIEPALIALDYNGEQRAAILAHVMMTGTTEGAPFLKPEHFTVFDCAFATKKGGRSISWRGHILMMAAVQPFLSGAISKTVNMPPDATVEDVKRAFELSWRSGVKAIAIYRDGAKQSQPLTAGNGKKDDTVEASDSMEWIEKAEHARLLKIERVAGRVIAEIALGTKTNPQTLAQETAVMLWPTSAMKLEKSDASARSTGCAAAGCTWGEPNGKCAGECLDIPVHTTREMNALKDQLAAKNDLIDALNKKLDETHTHRCSYCENTVTAETARRQAGGTGPTVPVRRKLPKRRNGWIEKFRVGGHKGYMQVGEYPDGTFGEVFIDISKEGSAISGLLGAFATAISIGVQHGVPLATFVEKFSHTKFEPSGFTGDEEIPSATSLIDYVMRKLGRRYLDVPSEEAPPPAAPPVQIAAEVPVVKWSDVDTAPPEPSLHNRSRAMDVARAFVATLQSGHVAALMPATKETGTTTDSPPCHVCGELMIRNGTCHKCANCGSTSGCS